MVQSFRRVRLITIRQAVWCAEDADVTEIP
jgi:hypothetical protein